MYLLDYEIPNWLCQIRGPLLVLIPDFGIVPILFQIERLTDEFLIEGSLSWRILFDCMVIGLLLICRVIFWPLITKSPYLGDAQIAGPLFPGNREIMTLIQKAFLILCGMKARNWRHRFLLWTYCLVIGVWRLIELWNVPLVSRWATAAEMTITEG
jgi:hypothetical protein